jgi:hypothetical protein
VAVLGELRYLVFQGECVVVMEGCACFLLGLGFVWICFLFWGGGSFDICC